MARGRPYCKVSPRLHTGAFGRSIRGETLDKLRAQSLAAYLASCPHGNAIGIFFLPLGYILADRGWSMEGAESATDTLRAAGFIRYNVTNEWVWVVEHFRHEFGSDPARRHDDGKKEDSRLDLIRSLLKEARGSGWVEPFLAHHGPSYPYLLGEFAPSDAPSDPPSNGASNPPSADGPADETGRFGGDADDETGRSRVRARVQDQDQEVDQEQEDLPRDRDLEEGGDPEAAAASQRARMALAGGDEKLTGVRITHGEMMSLAVDYRNGVGAGLDWVQALVDDCVTLRLQQKHTEPGRMISTILYEDQISRGQCGMRRKAYDERRAKRKSFAERDREQRQAELQAPGHVDEPADLDIAGRLERLAAAIPESLNGSAPDFKALAELDVEEIELRLGDADRELRKVAWRQLAKAERKELEADAAKSTATLADRLTAEGVAAETKRALAELVRKRAGLPWLSLWSAAAEQPPT